jgi:hypothetical protein
MLRLTCPGDAAELRRPALARDLMTRGFYTLVAEVETADAERAWFLTNNIDDNSWSREPGEGCRPVAPCFHIGRDDQQYGRRSSMVGDVFEVNGQCQVVDSFGFLAMPEAV